MNERNMRKHLQKIEENAKIEQMDAADALGVSARSLQNYESEMNTTVPQLDIVRNMVILYKDTTLAYEHIKRSPIGEFLPNLNCQSLTTAAISVLDDMNKVQQQMSHLVSITRDGKIDSSEEEEWTEFCQTASSLLNSINSLIHTKGGGENNVD